MKTLKSKWIDDPSPVWENIKTFLSDDSGDLDEEGPFLGVFDGEKMVGAFLVRWWNEYCCELHGGVCRDHWGRGPEICDLAGKSIFYSTPCLKLVAIIPAFNRLMCKCVQKLGMKQEGRITKSYLKWSRLHDQIVWGITKTEMRTRDDSYAYWKGVRPCHPQQ